MGKRVLGAMVVMLALVLTSGSARAITYNWNVPSGDWTAAGNWDPAGFGNLGTDNGIVGGPGGAETEEAIVDTTIFNPDLAVNGNGDPDNFSGGTLKAQVPGNATAAGTLTLNGGRIQWNYAGGSSRSLTASINVTSASVLEDRAASIGRALLLCGSLSGSGDLTVLQTGGASPGKIGLGSGGNLDASGYSGTLTVRTGSGLAVAGDLSFGGTVAMQSGSTLSLGAGNATLSFGNLTMDGVSIKKTGNNTKTLPGPVQITGTSTLDVAGGGAPTSVLLSGVFSGSGSLALTGADGATFDEGLRLSGGSNTYAGTITVGSYGRLVLDLDGSLPTTGSFASLVVEQDGLLTIGTGAGSADILVDALTLYNSATFLNDVIPLGTTYTDANLPAEYSGVVSFDDAESSISSNERPPVPEPAGLGLIGLALLGLKKKRS